MSSPLLARLCGNKTSLSYWSTSRFIFIHFRSDAMFAESGFMLTFQTVQGVHRGIFFFLQMIIKETCNFNLVALKMLVLFYPWQKSLHINIHRQAKSPAWLCEKEQPSVVWNWNQIHQESLKQILLDRAYGGFNEVTRGEEDL